MNYVYHIVPQNFEGSILYPLNELQDRFPKRYAVHIKKYAGREALLEREIPHLGCLWNDVLHLSPVVPERIREALQQAGFNTKPIQWFEISPEACDFNSNNTIIYLSPHKKRGDFMIDKHDFEPYSHDKLIDLSGEVPSATFEHYKDAKKQGQRPFMFNHIPHVLFRGTVETEHIKVIDV